MLCLNDIHSVQIEEALITLNPKALTMTFTYKDKAGIVNKSCESKDTNLFCNDYLWKNAHWNLLNRSAEVLLTSTEP